MLIFLLIALSLLPVTGVTSVGMTDARRRREIHRRVRSGPPTARHHGFSSIAPCRDGPGPVTRPTAPAVSGPARPAGAVSRRNTAVPQTQQAHDHNVLLRTFGEGPPAVDIRKVVAA